MLISYFKFSKGEQRAVATLLLIIVALGAGIAWNTGGGIVISNEERMHFQAQIDSFNLQLKKNANITEENRLNRFIAKRYDTINLFKFNPNFSDLNELLKLGLTEKQAGNVLTYKERGGTFLIKDDFKKIYGMRPYQYRILEPFIDLPDEVTGNRTSNKKENKNTTKQYTAFKPNTDTKEQLISAGFTEKQADVLINYRTKSGGFKTKESLRKLYFMNDSLFAVLNEKIYIEPVEKKEIEIAKEVVRITDLNSCDSLSLAAALGIPNYQARRICDYRTKLGGFVNHNQIDECVKLSSEVKSKLSEIVIKSDQIKTVNLNLTDAKTLSQHPYIPFDLAKAITNSRAKSGKFKSVNELVTRQVLTQQTLTKISPYLSVQ